MFKYNFRRDQMVKDVTVVETLRMLQRDLFIGWDVAGSLNGLSVATLF